MILVTAAGLYVLILAYVYGSAAVSLLDRFLAQGNHRPAPFWIVSVTGLVALATMAGYLSLIMSLGMAANAIVLLGALALYLGNRRAILQLGRGYWGAARTVPKSVLALFLLLSAFVLSEVVNHPKAGDTALYHLQVIKWIATFGVVPGLGNLHEGYAVNAMWHPLSALFGFAFLGVRTLHIVSGLLLLLAAGFFLGGVLDILKGSAALSSIVKAAAIPFSLFAYKLEVGSAATDMPVALLTWIAFTLCLDNAAADQASRSRTLGIIAAGLSIFAVTIKLSALPLVLLYLLLLYSHYRAGNVAALRLQIGLGVVIALPWLVRNVILTGYLVFPFPYIDVFDVDWKIPYRYVIDVKLQAQAWARLPGPDSRASLAMTLAEWLPGWLRLQPTYKLTILAAFVAMPLYVAVRAFRYRKRGGPPEIRDVLYLIVCVGVVFWFTSAPDPRYGFPFVFLAVAMAMAPLVQRVVVRFPAAARVLMLAVLVVYTLYQDHRSIRSLPRSSDLLWAPVPYPSEELWSERVGNIVVYGPNRGFCWDAPLPCTDVLKERLRPRGESLESGFRMVQAEPVR